MSVLRPLLAVLLVLTTSCAGTPSYVLRESRACPTGSFQSYAVCVDNLLAASRQPEADALRRELPSLVRLVSEARVGVTDAIDWVEDQIVAWQTRESESFQSGLETVAKVTLGAVVIVGTVALLSKATDGANNSSGSGGGGGSGRPIAYSRHPPAQGCCSWHEGVARPHPHGYYLCGPYGYYLCEDGWESGCPCR
jgi:hypothetical protein